MIDFEQRMQLFNILHLVCGVLAIAFLILTVFLFIKFGIWNAILARTGIAKKRSINEMQELNALSGRLVKNSAAKVAEQEFTGALTDDRKKARKNKRTAEIAAAAAATAAVPEEGTSVLQQETDGTSVLREQAPSVSPAPAVPGFLIIQDEQYIHTDERISEVTW